jgi:hypothetical protein
MEGQLIEDGGGHLIENLNVEHRPGGQERDTRIAEAAYRRAEARRFAPGAELDDWLAAEREIDDADEALHE